MGQKVKKLRPRKVYSEGFKKSRVSEYEKGELSVAQISRMYGLAPQSVYSWIYKYSAYNRKNYKIVEMSESQSEKVRQLEQKVKQLEQTLGQKQLQLEYYKQLVSLANETYDTDIEKNSNTQP